jgi:hypothetical protein
MSSADGPEYFGFYSPGLLQSWNSLLSLPSSSLLSYPAAIWFRFVRLSSLRDLRLCLLALSTSRERALLLLYASSPLANLFATSINSYTVLGFVLPNSSTRSEWRRPAKKASTARSSETSSAEFLIILHHYMYEHRVSSFLCMQDLTSSSDTGRLYVERKFLVNWHSNSPQLPMESLGRVLNQDRAAPVRCNCKLFDKDQADDPWVLSRSFTASQPDK